MASTAAMRRELAACPAGSRGERRAELTALLAFLDAVRPAGGQVMLQASCDSAATALRLERELLAGFDVPCRARPRPDLSGLGHDDRWLVWVEGDATALAVELGVVGRNGTLRAGLPVDLGASSEEDLAAAWRGALLTRGGLGPGYRAALTLDCPDRSSCRWLATAAQRLGVAATPGRGAASLRLVVRDPDDVVALLRRVGAPGTAEDWWAAERSGNAAPSAAARHAAARAASVAAAAAALGTLGPAAPQPLLMAGRLRVEHPEATLDELAALADPPSTATTLALRLRRLSAAAARARA